MDNEKYKKLNKQSPTMKYAIKLLQQVIKDIKSGECNEQELAEALVRFNPETNGYFKEEDFVNYDEVGNLLHLGWNRNRINELWKINNIKNYKVNNRCIGFPKKDILRLRQQIVAQE